MADRVWSEKDLIRRANQRLAVLQHAEEVSGNVAATCRYSASAATSFTDFAAEDGIAVSPGELTHDQPVHYGLRRLDRGPFSSTSGILPSMTTQVDGRFDRPVGVVPRCYGSAGPDESTSQAADRTAAWPGSA